MRSRDAIGWLGRLLLHCLLLLPRAIRRLVAGGRGARLDGLLLLPLGVLALLAVLLTTVNEIRVIFLYWWTDEVTPGTWGGPTMAGAWAVHALLGILLLPVLLAVMAGIRALARPLETGLERGREGEREGGRTSRRWYVLLADLLALAFLTAFVRQL